MIPRLIAIAALTLALAQTQKPDFSGTWQVDLQKSTSKKTFKANVDPNGPPAPPPPPDVPVWLPLEEIRHNEPHIKIAKRYEGGEVLSTLQITTDGKENINEMGDGEITHRSKTHWEGNRLVTEWTMERNGSVAIRGKDVRYFDGKNLILERTTEDSRSSSQSRQAMTRLYKTPMP